MIAIPANWRDVVPALSITVFWYVAGVVGGVPIAALLVFAVTLLLYLSRRFDLVVIGLITVFIFSDSYESNLAWAGKIKPFLLLFIGGLHILSIKRFNLKSRLFSLFMPYLLMLLVCIAFAPNATFFVAIQKTISYTIILLLVPNLIIEAWYEQGEKVFRTITYYLISLLVVSFMLKYISPEVATSHEGRLRGIFGNPNGLGIFLVVVTSLYSITKDVFRDLFSQKENLFITLIIIFVTLQTGSRGALVSVLLVLFSTPLFRISNGIGVLFIATMVLGYFYLFDFFFQLLVDLGLTEQLRLENLKGGSGRIIAWNFAWENILDSPFLGRGLGFDEKLMEDNKIWLSALNHQGGVHNTYLIIWLNAGVIGLILFSRSFLLIFIRGAKKTRVALPAMFAYMFSITFEPWLSASLNPYTSIFLIAATILFVTADQEKQIQREQFREREYEV